MIFFLLAGGGLEQHHAHLEIGKDLRLFTWEGNAAMKRVAVTSTERVEITVLQ